MSQNDFISNIELFRELCAQHVCTSVFALRTEDFVHKAPELKNNLIALLAEIFVIVELEKSPMDIVDIRGNNSIEGSTTGKGVESEKGAEILDEHDKMAALDVKENSDPNELGLDLNASKYALWFYFMLVLNVFLYLGLKIVIGGGGSVCSV